MKQTSNCALTFFQIELKNRLLRQFTYVSEFRFASDLSLLEITENLTQGNRDLLMTCLINSNALSLVFFSTRQALLDR